MEGRGIICYEEKVDGRWQLEIARRFYNDMKDRKNGCRETKGRSSDNGRKKKKEGKE